MKYGIQVVTPAAAYPVTVDQAREHARIARHSADNAAVTQFIDAATDYVQARTGRQLITAVLRATWPRFPSLRLDSQEPPGWRFGTFRVPRPPLVSVDLFKYVDVDGVLQTLASSEYQYSTAYEPGVIAPARLKVWPISDPFSLDAVQVTFTCGYGASGDSVPGKVKQAIYFLVAHLYEHREASIDVALQAVPWGLDNFIRSCGYGEVH